MFVHKVDRELSLKLAGPEDADALFQLTDGSREYLREWLPWLDFTKTVEDTKSFIESGRRGFSENKSMTTMVIYNGDIAGTAGFNEIDHTNKIVKIGYWLGQEFQGKGIMTRVAKALTDYALLELNMNRVEIRVASGNEKSAAIPKRLGFKEEGTIRCAEWLYDHYVDHTIYGILADEWKK
ncbi:GNAT family N-acetyltransferase [Halobacillus aidingensis]|uniref:Ribosomal-protein-serine acetyltransferase n=1 Tax=Halobacillus aidingensis TaxID=240303 RepID=A0A1H0LI32_HALAD|nr:GNAT family protein [Halobacillus aidingensis]SDO67696.1 ribosomal-protein-serine acetyltransferase [Halobacillus aidingensis]